MAYLYTGHVIFLVLVVNSDQFQELQALILVTCSYGTLVVGGQLACTCSCGACKCYVDVVYNVRVVSLW